MILKKNRSNLGGYTMLYKNLAQVYHLIFPAAPKIPFLLEQFKDHKKLLDIGCSDGRVAELLSKIQHEVDAVDLSDDMIQIAQKNSKNDSLFRVQKLDMLKLSSHFEADAFDGLFCIGNTLVHLNNFLEIKQALLAFNTVLKPGGKLIIQILNYDYILKTKPSSLELIENESLRFERHYTYTSDKILFSTSLHIKENQSVLHGSTELLPLTKGELDSLLRETGFHTLTWYSGYSGVPFDANAIPLIVVASK
jgi:glycine/sarcosine N-methyltransferase